MKKLILIICLMTSSISINAQEKDFPKLTGPFLGQKLPGMIPEIFAPEIFDKAQYPHGHLSFSNDGKTVCWSTMQNMKSTIYYTRFDGKVLSSPEKVELEIDSENSGPSFSYDGKKLYFSAQFTVNLTGNKKTAICYTEWDKNGWGKPVVIEPTIDTLMTKGQVSVVKSGNIYFSGRLYSERLPSIFVCKKEGDKFLPPEKVKGTLAESGLILDPWVDPDEKFMLLSIQPEQSPPMRTDIGISYRESDNTWSKPVKIKGEINTDHFERFPSLSPDGKFLFFIRSTSERFVGEGAHFYWVSAKIIEELKPKE